MTKLSRKGVTVRVECWVTSAYMRIDMDTGNLNGWDVRLACGHFAQITGPLPADLQCPSCEETAMKAILNG